MKIQARLTPTLDAQPIEFEQLAVAEEQAVWQAYSQGALREMYFQATPLVVTLVFEADSPLAVRQLLKSFPMVKAGLFDIQLTELGFWAPLSNLFAQDASVAPRLAG